MLRVLIAGLVAGFAMFAWEAVGHMLLPLGEMGISRLDNEVAVRDALQATIGDAEGLYLFPATTPGGPPPGPGVSGLLMYHPAPGSPFNPLTFVCELAIELIQGVALALVMSALASQALASRVGAAILVGVAAAVATEASYTVWYGFPWSYLFAQMVVVIVGYAAAGLVIAIMVRPREA
jgi:hypothetical protein